MPTGRLSASAFNIFPNSRTLAEVIALAEPKLARLNRMNA